MNLTPQEIEYLSFVLHTASVFTINRGEQVIAPGVKHKELKQKINDYKARIHW
jgi:hypothetical protein